LRALAFAAGERSVIWTGLMVSDPGWSCSVTDDACSSGSNATSRTTAPPPSGFCGVLVRSGRVAVMSAQTASSGTSDPVRTFPRMRFVGVPQRHIVTGSLNERTVTPSALASFCVID
jgi:hypothetical protein